MINLRGALANLRQDSANAVQFLRTVWYLWPTTTFAIILTAYLYLDKERISPLAFWAWVVTAVPIGLLVALLAWFFLGQLSAGFIQVVHAGGNLRPGPVFSLEEAMIARGDFQDARDTLAARLDGGPDDLAVHLRLAELHARWLKDPASAEVAYLTARKLGGDDRQRAAVANGLIDLYRGSGQTGRLMIELARFAKAYPTTRAGEDARRELQALKENLA